MPLCHVDGTERTGLEPSTHSDLPVPCVDPQHDPTGKCVGQFGEERGVLDRHTAHDEAIHTGSHVRTGRLDRTDAPAQLTGHSRRSHHPAHEFGLHGRSCLSAIEIDDMQATSATGGEPAGHLHGVVTKHGLAVIVALQEPHTPAAAKVNGGPEFHGQCLLIQVRSSSMPADWLFSG